MRRRYLIAYDIADPHRLRRTCHTLEDHGTRLQYSVFLCDLSTSELALLEHTLQTLIDTTEDSIVRIDLGPVHAARAVHRLGRPRTLPHSGPQII